MRVSRRKLLQWTTPLIVSVSLPVHAQTSSDPSSPPPPPNSPSPTPADPPPEPVATGNISITEILWEQTASSDPNILVDEFVEIRNDDSVPIDLTGWTLSDAGPFTFNFPSRVLLPGETCRIFTHIPQGANTFPSCEFTFGRTSPGAPGNYIFNNGGDTANLRDGSGTLIDSCSYSGASPSPFSC